MYSLVRVVLNRAVVLSCQRNLMTAPILRGDARSLMKLKKLQSEYQCEDGRPIFLKAGLRDRILYTLTLCLCVVGIFGVVETIYNNAKPNSWKNPPC